MPLDPDQIYRAIMAAVRNANEERQDLATQHKELRAAFDQLIEVLIGQKVLQEGHRKVLERAASSALVGERPRVRLRQFVDKYQMGGPDIDCASLLHLCHARCCSFTVDLTIQDVEERVVEWDIEQPYIMRRDQNDGYCTHLDRKTLGCTVYERRPATCRGFDCRYDKRVWLDWEKRIPAPMPDGVIPPTRE